MRCQTTLSITENYMIYLVSVQVCMHIYGQDDFVMSAPVRFLLDYEFELSCVQVDAIPFCVLYAILCYTVRISVADWCGCHKSIFNVIMWCDVIFGTNENVNSRKERLCTYQCILVACTSYRFTSLSRLNLCPKYYPFHFNWSHTSRSLASLQLLNLDC